MKGILMSLSSLALLLMAGTSPLAAAPISAPEDTPVVAAKEYPAAAEDAQAQDKGEIVVTARRREERVQEVPIAMAVIGGEELESGAFNVNRLQQSAADAAILFEQPAQLGDQHPRPGRAVRPHQ
jgi:iron complex outermembrane receptor protein